MHQCENKCTSVRINTPQQLYINRQTDINTTDLKTYLLFITTLQTMNQFVGGIRINRWVPVIPSKNTDRANYSFLYLFM